MACQHSDSLVSVGPADDEDQLGLGGGKSLPLGDPPPKHSLSGLALPSSPRAETPRSHLLIHFLDCQLAKVWGGRGF